MEQDIEKMYDKFDPSESDRTEGEGEAEPSILHPNAKDTSPAPATEDAALAEADAAAPPPGPGPVPGPVPDGGLTAWLQVVGSAAVLVNTWGIINTFGVFQTYYETDLLRDHSSSDISWIGSVQGALLFLVGVVAGPLYDAGYFRHLLFVGLFLIVLGQFMTSLCTSYWQVMLAQGIAMGLGMGLTFLPSAAILGQYFARHRALALGIASAGSPVAGVVFPIMFSQLLPKVGFGWATRAIAFILLGMAAIPIAFMRTRVPPSAARKTVIDRSALTDVPFLLFVAAGMLAFLTLYVAFFYLQLYATSHGVASESVAPYLVTTLNAGSIIGRLVPNALADRYGSLNMMLVCVFASAILLFGWPGIDNMGGAVVWALLYGAFSGGVVSLTPSVLVSLTPDMGRIGARMGMAFVIDGLAILVGTPIAGAILGDPRDAQWLGMILYGAFGLLLATLLYVASRLVLYRQKGGLKA